MKKKASGPRVVGYVRTDRDDVSLALPVIDVGGLTYLQVTILETLRSFELLSYINEYTKVDSFNIDMSDLRNQRIICYIRDGSTSFVWVDSQRDYLSQEAKKTDLPVSLRLQLADMLSDHDLRVELENRNFATFSTQSFLSSVLRNSLFENVMSNLREGINIREASTVSLNACRYLQDSSLDILPGRILDPLLSITTITKKEIEEALKLRAKSLRLAAEGDTFSLDPQLGQVRDFINTLKHSQRQELRISQILRALLDEPRVALSALKQYEPWTKAEAESVSRIKRRWRDIAAADDRRRSYIIAQMIPEVMRAEFGARRGRLLLDLVRALRHSQIVRDAIQQEYRRRRHTFSVQAYDHLIREELQKGDVR